jgi:hypothetical protein
MGLTETPSIMKIPETLLLTMMLLPANFSRMEADPIRVEMTDTEGWEGRAATFNVFRDGDITIPFTVDYTTETNGTALPNVNFSPQSGTLLFAPGQDRNSITVPILNDGVPDFGLSLRFG